MTSEPNPTSHPAATASANPARAGAIVWRWPDVPFGIACALPATAVALDDISRGLAFAFGVLPALIIGIAPRRRARWGVVAVGALMGLSILAGSILAEQPWIAIAALPILGAAAGSAATARPRLGMLLLTLALPLTGVGLSYTDQTTTGGLGIVLTVGSLYAAAISQLWPQRPTKPTARPAPPHLVDYGIRLGLAGGTAATIGFLLDWDHVGWATAAAMLVMRPSTDLVTTRGIGRTLSVLTGAVAGVALAETTTSNVVYAAAILAVLAATSATRTSRWYITSTFTTFLVISLLVHGTDITQAAGRLNERLGETVLGVLIAFGFGTALPLARQHRQPSPPTHDLGGA